MNIVLLCAHFFSQVGLNRCLLATLYSLHELVMNNLTISDLSDTTCKRPRKKIYSIFVTSNDNTGRSNVNVSSLYVYT